MNLVLRRETVTELSTAGRLFVDNVFECYTLEDIVRLEGQKVYGKTAIPAGKYKVVITQSARFKRDMPLLVDVRGFTGIRIHSGNTAEDTSGCILVGSYREGADVIRGSGSAFGNLYRRIQNALAWGENVEIEVFNPV